MEGAARTEGKGNKGVVASLFEKAGAGNEHPTSRQGSNGETSSKPVRLVAGNLNWEGVTTTTTKVKTTTTTTTAATSKTTALHRKSREGSHEIGRFACR